MRSIHARGGSSLARVALRVPVVALLLSATIRSALAAEEPFVALGPVGGSSTYVTSLNDAGQVAGFSYPNTEGATRAFLYRGGELVELGSFGGASSRATGLNNPGEVVGYWSSSPGSGRAFLYSEGAITELGTLGGSSSFALAVNDSGQVAGMSNTGGDVSMHAFRYADGAMTDLGTLGGSWSEGGLINSSGQVAGNSLVAGDAAAHAFLYTGGAMIDLGTLGGSLSHADAMNDAGQVVGWSYTASGDTHAFLYSAGAMIDLGTIGGSFSTAYAINDGGDVVGATGGTFLRRAFLYRDGTMSDLGTLGGLTSMATSINDAGQIAGFSTTAEGVADKVFLYSNGAMIDLGRLAGSGGSLGPVAINDAGQIAGVAAFPATSGSLSAHAYMSPCPPVPDASCLAAGKTSLQVRIAATGGGQIRWRWADGDEVLQSALGMPSTTTSYRLCLYDSGGGVDRLSTRLEVAPSTGWSDSDPFGWLYKDPGAGQDGVARIEVRAAEAGKTGVRFQARGESTPVPVPFSETELFEQDSRVSVQLRQEATRTCWASAFSEASSNTATRFRTKAAQASLPH